MFKKHLVAAVAVLGVVLGLFTPAQPSAQAACGRPSGCTAFELVHAGASYGWYPARHRYEFIGGRRAPSEWHRSGPGKLYQQNGMLTLVSRKGVTRDVRTIWTGVGYTQGRWEVRMRTARESSGKADPRVVLSLTPTKRAHTANFNIHTLPHNRFHAAKSLSRKVGADEWHEFAVEVTKTHISWFIDAKVVRTERRPAALSGAKLTMQAALLTDPGKAMNKTRLQLDWARYWTMKKKSKKSVSAPATTPRRFGAAC